MQRLSRTKRISLVILALGGCWIGALYMYVAEGLGEVSLQSLPIHYWAVLFFAAIMQVIIVSVWNPPSMEQGRSSSLAISFFIASLLLGSMFLLMALFNNLIQPRWGGNTAIFAAVGFSGIIGTYLAFRRYRVLK